VYNCSKINVITTLSLAVYTCTTCAILQILYATEGESKKPEDREEKDINAGPAAGVFQYKGHDFLQIHYRTPTNCESCNKTLWHMIHPPTALECRSKSNLRVLIVDCLHHPFYV